MKLCLIHDYLKEYGGAERVLEALHEIWPKAPIYTSFCLEGSKAQLAFKDAKIIESWFGKLPFCDKLISPLRFLLPSVWRSFDFSQYDLVISSASWAITKGFAKGKTKEICYCHTPPRYLYGYETSRDLKKHWYIRLYASVVNYFMRPYDFRQAQKVTYFIANSQETRSRIKKFYRKEAAVINPPVDLPQFKNQKAKTGDYFLTGGRLEAAKNFDLIIKACKQLKVPLKIYGTGSQENFLKSIAGSKTEFLGGIDDQQKFELMRNCRAFVVMATDEDFGITPLEAMATGRPVIAFKGGGYLETVIEGKTGVFLDQLTVVSLAKTLNGFKPEKYKFQDCQAQAQKFSKERFKKEVKDFVQKHAGTS